MGTYRGVFVYRQIDGGTPTTTLSSNYYRLELGLQLIPSRKRFAQKEVQNRFLFRIYWSRKITQIVLSTAGTIMRSSAINFSNWSG